MRHSRSLLFLAVLAIPALASAQRISGVYVGHPGSDPFDLVFSTEGGQFQFDHSSSTGGSYQTFHTKRNAITATQQAEPKRLMANAVNNGFTDPNEPWTFHQAIMGAGGGPEIEAIGHISGITLPPLDVNATDPVFLITDYAILRQRHLGFVSTAQGEADRLLPAVQKKWLPANFRVSIEGFPDLNVLTVSPISISGPGGDLDGDGLPDEFVSPPVITVDSSNAKKFRDWVKTAYDKADPRAMSIVYTDNNGTPLFTCNFMVSPTSVDFDDVLAGMGPIRVQLQASTQGVKQVMQTQV